jgi:hypothetical protein
MVGIMYALIISVILVILVIAYECRTRIKERMTIKQEEEYEIKKSIKHY